MLTGNFSGAEKKAYDQETIRILEIMVEHLWLERYT